jgi:colicin import membrane protein
MHALTPSTSTHQQTKPTRRPRAAARNAQVRQRQGDGKIKDTDAYSSECEDAAFAYYRRRIRETVAGYADETAAEWAARRADDTPHLQASLVSREVAALAPAVADARVALGVDAPRSAEQAAADVARAAATAAAATRQAAEAARDAAALADVPRMQRRVQRAPAVLAGLAGNAGLGLALGAGVAKLLRLAQRALAERAAAKAAAAAKARGGKGRRLRPAGSAGGSSKASGGGAATRKKPS